MKAEKGGEEGWVRRQTGRKSVGGKKKMKSESLQ